MCRGIAGLLLFLAVAARLQFATTDPMPDFLPIHGERPQPIPPHLRLPPRPPSLSPPPLANQGLIRVAYSDASTGVYLGSPAIAKLNNHTIIVAHDFFPDWGKPKRTAVVASTDGGVTWAQRAIVDGQYWSSLFVHRGALYLLGTDDMYSFVNAVSIARSTDGGFSWNRSSLLAPPPGCQFATGAVPVVVEGGRLWRGMELWCGVLRWPQDYHALLIHAAAGGDLLDPAAWSATRAYQFNSSTMLPTWVPGPVVSGGYLEGNAVRLPFGGGVGLLLRCRVFDGQGRLYSLQQACLFKLGPQPADNEGIGTGEPDVPLAARQLLAQRAGAAAGAAQPGLHVNGGDEPATASAATERGGEAGPAALWTGGSAAPPLPLRWHGFLDMPGGGNKFQVRYDAASRQYVALTNPSIDRYGSNSDARNILVLVHSRNMLDWRIGTTVLVPNDGLPWEQSLWHTGYHYADIVIDGADLLAAIRTAYDGAHSYHDSNQITFKRVANFRQYLGL